VNVIAYNILKEVIKQLKHTEAYAAPRIEHLGYRPKYEKSDWPQWQGKRLVSFFKLPR
jgi:hypothetical protein